MKKPIYTTLHISFRHILMALLLLLVLPAAAQKRDKTLGITVSVATGESLEGQQVNVKQTDYGVSYPAVTLDADGKATLKVYSGNHTVTVERQGYVTVTTQFEVAESDTRKDIELTLVEKTRTPFSLTAKLNVDAYTGENSVALSWNTEAPAFFDDFESYDPFAVEFGQWTGIDGDHLQAAPLEGDYPNRGVMQYAQIINPLTVQPMWWYSYPVLRPYSGKQYVGFVRTSSGEANNDWLISPEIVVGTDNVLSFRAKAADKYTEKFLVYITTNTGSPQQEDFTCLTQGNYEAVDYKSWREVLYDLSAYAGKKVKIAVRYISEANDGGAFMLMVDDFYVGQPNYGTASPTTVPTLSNRLSPLAVRKPQLSPANPNEEFDVYQDGNVVGTTDGYTFTVANVADGSHVFGVKAKYIAAESDLVTTSLTVSHDNYAKLDFNVSADSKLSADGQKINVLSTLDAATYQLSVAGGNASLASLPKGTYIIGVEQGAFKGYSSETALAGDTLISIMLEDNVLAPYNITADLETATDGTTTAALRWNQDLGFSDSFEQYDDFATGSFGEWTTVDNDRMPVYPISLGGQIIAFPGSGTQNNPTAIAPMVFNPWNTVPAMLPSDPAMQAPDGEKYVIFFSPQGSRADKWLISPELTIYDGYELKVTAKSYTDQYPESFEFAVSETGTDPSSFTTLSTAYNMPSSQWQEYTTPLWAYAGKKIRVGVHYVSTDTFFAQLDDFSVSPAEGTGKSVDYGNVVKYNIYLDGALAGESTTSAFTLKGISSGDHTVGIEAVYKNDISERTYYHIVATSVDVLNVEAIPADAAVFNLQGQRLAGTLGTQPKGVYVVKYAGKTVKARN